MIPIDYDGFGWDKTAILKANLDVTKPFAMLVVILLKEIVMFLRRWNAKRINNGARGYTLLRGAVR